MNNAKITNLVKHIRNRLEFHNIKFQTIGHVKFTSIWIFAQKTNWEEIKYILKNDNLDVKIHLSDSSI